MTKLTPTNTTAPNIFSNDISDENSFMDVNKKPYSSPATYHQSLAD